MAERIYVRPVEGRRVPDLEEGPGVKFPEHGKMVNDSPYIRRRITEGALVRDETLEEGVEHDADASEPAAETDAAAEPKEQASTAPSRRRGSVLPPLIENEPNPSSGE